MILFVQAMMWLRYPVQAHLVPLASANKRSSTRVFFTLELCLAQLTIPNRGVRAGCSLPVVCCPRGTSAVCVWGSVKGSAEI